MNRIKKEKVVGQDIDKNKVELDVSKMKFRPSVYGVLVEDGKVFLSKQFDGYDFPGGEMEIDETIKEALQREFKEETGLEVEIGEILECRHDFWLTPFEKQHCNSILMYYSCKKIGGEISIDGFDEYEKQYAGMPEWIDIKDIDKIKFYNPVDSIAVIKKADKIIKK